MHRLNTFHRLHDVIDYLKCDCDGAFFHWLSKHLTLTHFEPHILPYITCVYQSHKYLRVILTTTSPILLSKYI